MAKNLCMALCLVCLALVPAGRAAAEKPLENDNTFYDTHGISREEHVISQLRSFFDSSRQNGKSGTEQTGPFHRDITLLLKQAARYYDSFSADGKAYVDKILRRPTSTSNTWPWDNSLFYLPAPVLEYEPTVGDYPNIGGRYKFWYVTHTDPDGSGTRHTATEPFLMTVVQAFEDSYTMEVGTLGYTAPLSDAGLPDNGGDEKIDIYLMNCGTTPYRTYGYTAPVGYSASSNWSSYMVVDNDFSEFVTAGMTAEAAMQVTVSHELHHAVQFAINIDAQDWIMEATSAWMESQVYPSIKDNLQYLNGPYGYFASTDIPLDDDYYQLYNAWIFLEYMDLMWGRDTVRDVWDYLASQNLGMTAVSLSLADQGTTVKTAFTDFVRKNYSQTGFYPDADNYDEVQMTNSGGQTLDYSGSGTHIMDDSIVDVEHLAAAYYAYRPGTSIGAGDNDTLYVQVTGEMGAYQTASVIVKNAGGSYDTHSISLDSTNSGYVYVTDFNQVSVVEVVLALVHYSSSPLSSTARFRVQGGLGLTPSGSLGDDDSGGCFIASGFSFH